MSSMVKLNVGGEMFITSKLTLKRYPNSFLAKLCDEEENSLKSLKDENGFIFIDRNKDLFKYVLDFLRDNELNINDKVLIKNLRKEANFFLLEELVELCDKKLEVYNEFKMIKLKLQTAEIITTTNILTKHSLYFKKFLDESLVNLEDLKDEDGFIFIDRNPYVFRRILQWLKSGTCNGIDVYNCNQFLSEAEFYQIDFIKKHCEKFCSK